MNESEFIKTIQVWSKQNVSPTEFQDIPIFNHSENHEIKSFELGDVFRKIIVHILSDFEFASRSSHHGDSYLFFKYFTSAIHHSLSLYSIIHGERQYWKDPQNVIKLIENDFTRTFLLGLFPEMGLENTNHLKLNFIDWIGELYDEIEEKIENDELDDNIMPFNYELMESYFRAIYQRDYLHNFRQVSHCTNLFRSPLPQNYLTESPLLENFMKNHDIKLVIDLRGSREAKPSKQYLTFLEKLGISNIIVDFNEPHVSGVSAPGYVRKLMFLKETVKQVFIAVSTCEGSTLFHCVSGKDRTGVMAALFQKLLGCSDEIIIREYTLSGHDTRAKRIQEVLEYLNSVGGIEKYLESCGITVDMQKNLKIKIHPKKP